MKALFDTNILIDYLNGIKKAKIEIDRFDEKLLSIISMIEVLAGVKSDDEEKAVRSFLALFNIISLSNQIAEQAVTIRKKTKMKIPDAIIYATAKEEGSILVTRNTKDFKKENVDIRVPYKI